jgi:leader peptidase (prepilin peptidase)/N-methyltransferase
MAMSSTLASLALFFPFATLLSIVDWKFYRLPHPLTIACLCVGLTAAAMGTGVLADVRLSAIGALAGFLSLGPLSLIRPRWIGFGDGVYLAAIGAFVGWNGILPVLFLGSAGSILAEGTYRVSTGNSRRIPFGVYLSIAAAIVLAGYRQVSIFLPKNPTLL